jgi:hypothetical protein
MLLHAWLIYPVVLAVLSCGCGLLVRRVAGVALPAALVLPVGFATLVVVGTALTFLDATAELAAPAMALLALVGFVVAGRGALGPRVRSGRAWVWPAVAALLPAVAIAAPVLLTGQPGFTGYTRIVDLAFQLDLAQQFVTGGRSIPADPQSSFESVVARTLGAGYPGGVQAVLGATAQVSAIDPIWAGQPYLAFLGAMLGLSLWWLLRGAIGSQPGRAVAAGVAAQPTILYAYGITGGVKELGAATMVALCAALLTVLPREERTSAAALLPLVLAVVAGLAVFTLGIVPWIAVLLVVVFGPGLVRARRLRRLRSGRAGLAVALGIVVVAVPLVAAAVRVAPLLSDGGPADLGNLAAPVPAWAAIGPWLTPDHRYPLEAAGSETLTAVLAALVLLLAVTGVANAVARRDRVLLAAGAAGAVGLAVVLWRGSAWVELKAITTTAPLCVALAFAGAAALGRTRRLRPLAVVAGGLVIVAVVAGNALVYRGTSLAPYDRLAELQDIAERFEGQGPTLHPHYEEHAEYLLREVGAVGLANDLDLEFEGLRPAAPSGIRFVRDLDTFTLEALRRFDLIVTRRDPTASRPPSAFTLVATTPHYTVWQRREQGPRVVAHVPLETGPGKRTPEVCAGLARELRAAGPDARLAYAPAPDGLLVAPSEVRAPWPYSGGAARLARGPGSVRYEASVKEAARYAVWLQGSFGREVEVSVDGRPIGDLRWQGNYPEHYEPVATVQLAAGEHVIEVTRGGGSALPGTGNELAMEGTITRIGPIVLAPPESVASPVLTVERGETARACRNRDWWDWAEVVLPAADPTGAR